MKFKNAIVLGLSTILLFSCSKTISSDDAKKFIKENYSNKNIKTPKSISLSYDGSKTCGDVYKAEIEVELALLAASLDTTYEKGTYKVNATIDSTNIAWDNYSITHNYIINETNPYLTNSKATFSIKGKELTIKVTESNSNHTVIFNDNGQVRHLSGSNNNAAMPGAEGYKQIDFTQEAKF